MIIIFLIIISKIPCKHSKLNRNTLFGGEIPENIYIYTYILNIYIYIFRLYRYILKIQFRSLFFFLPFPLFNIYSDEMNKQEKKKNKTNDRPCNACVN